MYSKTKIVRNAYLYIASLISLLFVAIGAYILLNTALKTYVLPKAEKGGYDRCNSNYMVTSGIADVEKIKDATALTNEQRDEIKQMLSDYEKWKMENTGEECYKAERQSNVADAITMIVIALPIFLFHWRLVKKEKEDKEIES